MRRNPQALSGRRMGRQPGHIRISDRYERRYFGYISDRFICKPAPPFVNLGVAVCKSYPASAGVLVAGQLNNRGLGGAGNIINRVINRIRVLIHEHPHLTGTGKMQVRLFFCHIVIGAPQKVELVSIAQGGVHGHASGAPTPTT